MPALSTHVLQSGNCLEVLKPELEARGIEVNQDFADFVGAAAISHDSLGLLQGTGYARCFVTAHEKNTDAFFLGVIAYIKENKLQNNANAMAFLYGHIMHYALDTCAHPLIYYMTEKHPAKCFGSALEAHALFEAWVDTVKEKEEQAKAAAAGGSFDPNFPFRQRVGKGGIDALIDAVYENVHGQKTASKGYRQGIKLWAFYQFRLRSFILKRVQEYHADFKTMLNENGTAFQHPVTGDTLNTTFDQAYDQSIELACELVRAANANIYDGADNEEALKKAFGNSYDSGIAWDDPRARQHFKQYS